MKKHRIPAGAVVLASAASAPLSAAMAAPPPHWGQQPAFGPGPAFGSPGPPGPGPAAAIAGAVAHALMPPPHPPGPPGPPLLR